MDSKYLSEAINCYSEGKLKKALNLLKKSKHLCIKELKLKFQINLDLKHYQLCIITADELLTYDLSVNDAKEINFYKGICLSFLGEKTKAIESIENSIAIDSTVNNSAAMFNLLCLYFQEAKNLKAESLASRMLNWNEYNVKVLVILFKIAGIKGDKEKLEKLALILMVHAKEFDEEFYIHYVRHLIALRMFDEASKVIEQFERLNNVTSPTIHAELLYETGKYNELLSFYEKIKGDVNVSYGVLYFKANALHQQKLYAEAFDAYQKSALLKQKEIQQLKVVDLVPKWNKLVLKPQSKEVFQDNKCGDRQQLCFIFGFPRSGTTLLDNILDTQEEILVLSEKGIVPHVIKAFRNLGGKFPEDIFSLQSQQIAHLQNVYFQTILEMGYQIDGKSLIVDKGPHHTELLPFLNLLFPESKLVVMLRHPLDVCLSCFQQNFELNEHNSYLTTFDKISTRYNQIFSLLEVYQSKLSIPVKEVKYESLVSDFDNVMNCLFDYMGIKPSSDFESFHKHAANKFVTSASRGQTDKALYKDAVYKWHNYEEQLLPYKEKLSYFIEKYGYQNS